MIRSMRRSPGSRAGGEITPPGPCPGRAARSARRWQVTGTPGRREPARRAARRRCPRLAAMLRPVRKAGLRSFQRSGQDWYCASCRRRPPEPCSACGSIRPVASRDREGRPRCSNCPARDGRDPVAVIQRIVTGLDPGAGRKPSPPPSAGRPADRLPAEGRMGAGGASGAADRGGAPRPAARDPAVHRDAPRRGHRRGRPPVLRALRPRGAHRQAAGRRPGLPVLHRALPRRAVRTMRSHPRARHPRRAGPAGLRELLRHRPGEPGDLRRLRAAPPGRPADRGRAALFPLPCPPVHGLLRLRPDGAMRDLPGNRAAMVPGLPAPAGRVLGLRPPSPRSPPARWTARSAPAALRRRPGQAALSAATRIIPAPAVRPLHRQRQAGRADGTRRRLAAARPAGAAPRDRRRRAHGHRDAVGGQAVHSPSTVRPRRRQHPAHPPGTRRAAPAPGPRLPAPDPRRHRRAALARRGDDPARGIPPRPAGLPGRPRTAQDPAPLPDLAPGQAHAQPQQRETRHPAASPPDPQPGPRRHRVPGLARLCRPHPGQLPAGRPRSLARQRPGRLPGRSRPASAGPTPPASPPATFPPPPAGPAPPPSSTARTGGTSHAVSCTTTRSGPRTASPGSSSSSTPRASRRSAA